MIKPRSNLIGMIFHVLVVVRGIGKRSYHVVLLEMLLDNQSRPSYSPWPEVAEALWTYMRNELSQSTNTTIQTTCILGNPICVFGLSY